MSDSAKPDGASASKNEQATLRLRKTDKSDIPSIEHVRAAGLEVVGGAMDGQSIFAEGSVVTIGRSRDNDLCLGLDDAVSTRHARIVREQEHFWIEDLGSTNGTFVGDLRIQERTLIGPGTLFRVGQTRLEFQTK